MKSIHKLINSSLDEKSIIEQILIEEYRNKEFKLTKTENVDAWIIDELISVLPAGSVTIEKYTPDYNGANQYLLTPVVPTGKLVKISIHATIELYYSSRSKNPIYIVQIIAFPGILDKNRVEKSGLDGASTWLEFKKFKDPEVYKFFSEERANSPESLEYFFSLAKKDQAFLSALKSKGKQLRKYLVKTKVTPQDTVGFEKLWLENSEADFKNVFTQLCKSIKGNEFTVTSVKKARSAGALSPALVVVMDSPNATTGKANSIKLSFYFAVGDESSVEVVTKITGTDDNGKKNVFSNEDDEPGTLYIDSTKEFTMSKFLSELKKEYSDIESLERW